MNLLNQYQLYSSLSLETSTKEIDEKDIRIISCNNIIESSPYETTDFKKRLLIFKNVMSISEAKIIAKKYFPTNNEVTIFSINGGKCTIVNREDLFRITYDTDLEFISYSFE